ncbi:MAG: helix-turn-helix domain-containing protein [Clostridiales bacterium]|nr:helix-turn-helix domain-containing protein [Clostridiales bacterium]
MDDGKIKALRDAGWTTKAIAEEIGCSQPTICNHLKAMGYGKGDES